MIDKPMFMMNRSRIKRVVRRIARGLYFHETGTMLDPKAKITTLSFEELRNADDDVRTPGLQILELLSGVKQRQVGGPVFTYRFIGPGPDGETGGGWLMVFYERVAYLAFH